MHGLQSAPDTGQVEPPDFPLPPSELAEAMLGEVALWGESDEVGFPISRLLSLLRSSPGKPAADGDADSAGPTTGETWTLSEGCVLVCPK